MTWYQLFSIVAPDDQLPSLLPTIQPKLIINEEEMNEPMNDWAIMDEKLETTGKI